MFPGCLEFLECQLCLEFPEALVFPVCPGALEHLAKQIKKDKIHGGFAWPIMDENGNSVGHAELGEDIKVEW